jgi:hypothetical protein
MSGQIAELVITGVIAWNYDRSDRATIGPSAETLQWIACDFLQRVDCRFLTRPAKPRV